jgi:hypothetical protein
MVQLPILNLSVVSSSLRSFAYSSLRSAQNPFVGMRFQHVAAAGLTTSAVAVNLFVSSYSGIVTSLQLAPSAQGPGIGGYVLTTTASNNGSGPQPSWLTKDPYNNVI